MSYQSGIHSKMAIFNRISHAPEPSLGSKSASILLVRLFYLLQANKPETAFALIFGRFRITFIRGSRHLAFHHQMKGSCHIKLLAQQDLTLKLLRFSLPPLEEFSLNFAYICAIIMDVPSLGDGKSDSCCTAF